MKICFYFFRNIFLIYIGLCSLTLICVSCKPNTELFKAIDYQKLGYILNDNPNLSTFHSAVQLTELRNELISSDSMILLAPTDQFFLALGLNAGSIKTLPGSSIAAFVNQYVLDDYLDFDEIPYFTTQKIYSKSGNSLFVGRWLKDGKTYFTINGIRVEDKPLKASNGIIYILNGTLQEREYTTTWEALQNQFSMSLFVQAIIRANLIELFENLDQSTVFVPSNDAMNAYGLGTLAKVNQADVHKLRQIIEYHVLRQPIMTGELSFNINLTYSGGFATLFTSITGHRAYQFIQGLYGIREVSMLNKKSLQFKFFEGRFNGDYGNQLFLVDGKGYSSSLDFYIKDILTQSSTVIHQIDRVLSYNES